MDEKFYIKPPKSVESLIIYNYIRYETLEEMTKVFAGSSANSVNIYIDLYQILLRLFRNDIQLGDKYSLVSYIINLCSHYRAFYRKYYGCHTKIFLVFTNSKMITPQQFIRSYNKTNDSKFAMGIGVTNYISNNISVLDILCRYINDVYYIGAPFETSVLIYDRIVKELSLGNSNPNIILSSSKMMYQVPVFAKPQTVIFSHTWVNGDITYRIIDKDNALLEFLDATKRRGDSLLQKASKIHPELLSLILALTNIPSRDVYSMLSITRAINIVYSLINKGNLYNRYNSDLDSMAKLLNMSGAKIDDHEFKSRFKALDLLYQHSMFSNTNYASDIRYYVNLQDPDAIKMINNKYFARTPLDLDRL